MNTNLDYQALTDWMKVNAAPINTLTPSDSVEDLEPIREIIGDARVVALGENSHFISEFGLLRHRIIRFLIEHCGFTAHALEFGFSDGFIIDDWLQGRLNEAHLKQLIFHYLITPEILQTLRWIKNYNLQSQTPVQFMGVDIPCAGGSLLPALSPIKEYLRTADADTLSLIKEACLIAIKFEGASMAQAAPLYGSLSEEERNILTCYLTRINHRLHALAPEHIERFGQQKFDEMVQHLKSALYADYNLSAMSDFIAGTGLYGDMGARDSYMADSVLWHLQHIAPGSKIILVAHNAHIQKTSVNWPGSTTLPMGQHLAQQLGKDYVAIGLTSSKGDTAALYPDENATHGFRVEKTLLDNPIPNSIESVFTNAELGTSSINLKQIPREYEMPTYTRCDSEYLEIPIQESFDGLIHIPHSHVIKEINM